MVLTFLLLVWGAYAQSSPFIVVDQFGYLPESQKIAVVRGPQIGFDADQSFVPGPEYGLYNAETGTLVFSDVVVPWNSGATDDSSGDKVWYFDFSSVTAAGRYYVQDLSQNVRSYEFEISAGVYNEVLHQAFRTFYYQRVGFAKQAPFAMDGWEDGASHLGPSQDPHARKYDQKNNVGSERDLQGGWYDAGDYNKYTNWTASYVVDLIKAYQEYPQAWDDHANVPESGNGIPDILDEVKWGLDHLLRLQEDDGGVISIVGLDHASPPSAATGPSYYGDKSTSATLSAAAAFASGALVFDEYGISGYVETLKAAAIKAWDWAETNPEVVFYNNDATYGTSGLGAGQQEVDDYGRLMTKLKAAVYLFRLTDVQSYKDFFDSNYDQAHLIVSNYAYPFELSNQETLLLYASLEHGTASVQEHILSVYEQAMTSDDNFGAIYSGRDPYRAFLKDYTWGSNGIKAAQGIMYNDLITYLDRPESDENVRNAAQGYLHYLHGINPMGKVYLSNMSRFGGDHSVNEFYHSWYADGSLLWDKVGVSTYGPAPGFLVGGPNPYYQWDNCCPGNCGSTANNAVCTSMSIIPPQGQPDQKSYRDFNTNWPLNSWSVTENSNGYQVNYLRLLSRFVNASLDCYGEEGGTAVLDVCGRCTGGSTGLAPSTDPNACGFILKALLPTSSSMRVYPNPTRNKVSAKGEKGGYYFLSVVDTQGNKLESHQFYEYLEIDLSEYAPGVYFLKVRDASNRLLSDHKVIKDPSK